MGLDKRWNMEINYCAQCGRELTLREIGDEGEQKYCPACGRFYFDNPACCVLTAIINERRQVLLLRQNYISRENYVLCSGYLKKGDTLEQTVRREVLEETGQEVLSCEYLGSYYFEPRNVILAGFIARVKAGPFGSSAEVDGLRWAELDEAVSMVERRNNFSGIHLDRCIEKLKEENQYGTIR